MKLSKWLPRRGLESVVNLFGVVRRRSWSSSGKAHIELPDMQGDEYRDFAYTLAEELERLPGVNWAAANGAISRMIVSWDEERLDVEQVLDVVNRVEVRFQCGPDDYSEEKPSHPGDDEPIVRAITRMGADVVGGGLGVMMKIARRSPGRRRFDLAAVMSIVDNVPHIRQALSRRFGRTSASMSIGVTNPLIQGLGSGPISPIVDLFYQGSLYSEAVHRRQSWNKREPDLCARPDTCSAPEKLGLSRPIPIPAGPIERYADDAWAMSLGGFLVGLADTQDLSSAVTPVLDALPKPARYGRDSFCAGLTAALAARDMVVMDRRALRRLDRIDCVIVDDRLLVTDRWALGRIVAAEGTDKVESFHVAEDLLDPLHPELHQRQGEWELQPATDVEVDKQWTSKLRSLGAHGDFLALSHDGQVCAIFSLRRLTDYASEALINSIHRAGLELIIAGEGTKDTGRGFHPDRVVDREDNLHSFIRHIQRDHQVVAYLGNGGPAEAMEVADCSVGFCLRDASTAWGADIIAGDDLRDATFFIESITEARDVSEKCAALAGAGAGIGALSAIRGLDKTHPTRVMLAVNAASVIALIYGTFRARKLSATIDASPPSVTPWHRLRVSEVLEKLQTSAEGLSESEAEEQQTEKEESISRPRHIIQSIGRELANPLTPVLAAGAAVSATVGSITDAGIVGTVIAVNGLIGGMERFKAEESIEKMAQQEVLTARTRRDGRWQDVEESDLVVGDIITLESGDVVPADCRIVESERLEVDESSLTGESLPVLKDEAPNFSHLAAERSSMLYDGTAVVAGTVTAVVVATGAQTEAQRSLWFSEKYKETESGVEARLRSFADMVIPFAGISGGTLLSLGVFRRQELTKLIGPAVNLAVAAVPEGLPLLSTAAQLAAARRLSDRNVIVQNPRAMEAIGRVDTLCIDKTGTLTEGTLTLNSVFDGEETLTPEQWGPTHQRVMRSALRATPIDPDEGVLPHATDRAIVEGAESAGVGAGDWRRGRELPFKPELAFHAVIGRAGNQRRLAIKGSPESVLERCSGQRLDGKWKRLGGKRRTELLKTAENLAGRGLRTLAVAECRHRGDNGGELKPEDVHGLTFSGFITLSDPLRPTSADAVAALRAASVSPIMLTGDHPETARRIAEEVGITGNGRVLTGDQIESIEDDELAEILPEITVIARMTPAHKVRIVEALQQAGRLVAMTGDGGNDAAAIRLADAGIALGAESSGAARDAADLVVTDARIETLVDAVVEGRAMWRSVRDAVSILIGGNLGEVGFMLASGIVDTTPALNARQLLLVNLFTDVAPAMAIALRPPPEITPEELLHEGPEESLGEALEHDIMWRAILTGSAGFGSWFVAKHTFQKKRASTVGLLAIVTSQLGQTLTAAKPTLPVWIASLGSTAILLAIIEIPGVSQLFGSRPLGPIGLTTAFGGAAAATVASAIIPRVPVWRQAVVDRFPERKQPVPKDFLDEFYAFSPTHR